MKIHDCAINHGGLMRCCIATLQENNIDVTVGDVVSCKYCNEKMEIVDINGVVTIRWSHL